MTRPSVLRFTGLCTAALATLLFSACQADPPRAVPPLPEPEAPESRALFTPAEGALPTPMDALLDEEARTQLGVAALPAASDELFARYAALGGFPVTSEIAVPLSVPVAPAAFDAALLVVDAVTGARVPVDVRFDESALTLRAAPLSPWSRGAKIVVGLRALHGVDGDALEPDLVMRALLARSALHHEGLEAQRQALQPALQTLSDAGASREELIAAFTFTVTDAPSVWFDERNNKTPFPGAWLVSDDGIRLPPFPGDLAQDPKIMALAEELRGYDGFSTTAALVFDTTDPIERDTALADGAVRLFRLVDDKWQEHTDLERGVSNSGTRAWIRPRVALEHSSTYAWLVTDAVRAAQGDAFAPMGRAHWLMLDAPLVEDGKSALLGVPHAEAARFEGLRKSLGSVLDDVGGEHASVSLFETANVPAWVFEHTDQLVVRNTPVTLTNIVDSSPWDRGLWIAMTDVETVITGRMTTLDFLDPYTRRLRAGDPVEREIEFILTIPEGVDPEEEIPVVIFGHGLITSRELGYGVANILAQRGLATFSIDFPLHGERSICETDTHCAGDATCAADGRCIEPDGSFGRVRSVGSPWEYGPDVPITTGQSYIDPVDIVASRDHFLQGVVDLKQAVRVIRQADFVTETGYQLDREHIGYTGISLGGIHGAMLAGVEANVQRYALNVPGADMIRLMLDSNTIGGALQSTLDDHGLERDSDEFFVFKQAARWVMDRVDPLNLAHHATWSVLWYDDVTTGAQAIMPAKQMILQMAEGDLVVPNSGTRQLSDRTGVPISEYNPLISNHGFLVDPTSFEGADARDELADFLADF
jgi:hypothetical protein